MVEPGGSVETGAYMAATLIILALAIAAFMSNRVPLGVVALGVSLALWATGVLSLGEVTAGFGDPTVIFIASLFVVSEALESTGVTTWVSTQVISRAGEKRSTLILVVGILGAIATALISVNGAVAALVPVVVVVAIRAKLAPSQMLIPLAFAAHAGSLLALTGTPVNIIVSEQAANAGARPFGFFEFALVGIPLLVGTLLIVVFFGRFLLPTRPFRAPMGDLRAHAETLREQYDLDGGSRLIGAKKGISEVVVAPRSELIGTHAYPGMVTGSGSLVILAIQRGGENITEEHTVLMAGDTLLLTGTWSDLTHEVATPGMLVVDEPDMLRRGVPLGIGAKRAMFTLLAMIILLATGIVPPAIAGLAAAMTLVVTGVVTPPRAYRSISWTTIVLIGGMIPLSTAVVQTGTADLLATGLLGIVGDGSPHLALLAICALTMVLGQLISNTATVLIVAPIALVVAGDLGVSVLPFMMALTVAGAAAFLTPVATPANTMVLEPGGYRFGDYWKLGLPLLLFFLAVAVFYVPVIWPF